MGCTCGNDFCRSFAILAKFSEKKRVYSLVDGFSKMLLAKFVGLDPFVKYRFVNMGAQILPDNGLYEKARDCLYGDNPYISAVESEEEPGRYVFVQKPNIELSLTSDEVEDYKDFLLFIDSFPVRVRRGACLLLLLGQNCHNTMTQFTHLLATCKGRFPNVFQKKSEKVPDFKPHLNLLDDLVSDLGYSSFKEYYENLVKEREKKIYGRYYRE